MSGLSFSPSLLLLPPRYPHLEHSTSHSERTVFCFCSAVASGSLTMDPAPSPLYLSLLQLLLPDYQNNMGTPYHTPPDDTRLVSTFPHARQAFSIQPHWATASPPTEHGPGGYVSPDPSPTYPAGGPRGLASGYRFPYQGSYPGQNEKQVGHANGHQGSGEDSGRRSSGESKKRPSKRFDGKQPTFLTKLYQ